jgi:hypothetical protein
LFQTGLGVGIIAPVTHRVRSVDHVPLVRRQVTPPAAPAVAEPLDEKPARTGASWGLPSPADAEALRGLPAIGRGIRGGAIRGTTPGQHIH